jgi:hypothetical protein
MMRKKTWVLCAACSIVLLVGLWGCATIMHGTSQKIGISSTPTGAKVSIDNKDLGVTPLFADLKRGEDHIVKIEMEGYQKSELTITKSVSGWVWGNIVFGGLIGLAVDAMSGGLYNLSPEQLNTELKKQGVSAIEKDGGVYLLTVLSADPAWKKIGNLSPGSP